MMNQAHGWVKFAKFFSVSFLTLLVASPVLAASSGNRRPAAQGQPTRRAAPPADEAPMRPVTSENDEAGTLPERIDVQSMKRRYWTVGNEDLMDVVQNRLYTKKGRVETAVRYGFWSDDAFLDQKTIGFSLGYHLNEFFSVHGFYASVSHSTNQAWDAASATGLTPVTNPAKSVMGAEGRASLLYGKLSVLGNAIVYYDFNLAAGLSQHKAEIGTSTGFFVGLGQQFYLDKTWFLTVDYRMLLHTDKFPKPPAVDRALTTNWIQLGIGAFL